MDLTALWSFYQKHKDRIGYAICGIAILIVGFQAGRVTSPYYAAHPIVFQEECKTASGSGGSAEELVALKEAGQNLTADSRSPGVGETASQSPAQSPAVAGANAQAAQKGQFVGSKNSDKYHHPDCSTWQRIKPENQVWFSSREDAESKGYKPTKCTAEKIGL